MHNAYATVVMPRHSPFRIISIHLPIASPIDISSNDCQCRFVSAHMATVSAKKSNHDPINAAIAAERHFVSELPDRVLLMPPDTQLACCGATFVVFCFASLDWAQEKTSAAHLMPRYLFAAEWPDEMSFSVFANKAKLFHFRSVERQIHDRKLLESLAFWKDVKHVNGGIEACRNSSDRERQRSG